MLQPVATTQPCSEFKIAAHPEEAREKLQCVEISTICSPGIWKEAKPHNFKSRRKALTSDAPGDEAHARVRKEDVSAERSIDQAFQKLQLEADAGSDGVECYFDALDLTSPEPARTVNPPNDDAGSSLDQEFPELQSSHRHGVGTPELGSEAYSLPAAARGGLRVQFPHVNADLQKEADYAKPSSESLSDCLALPCTATHSPARSWSGSHSQASSSTQGSAGGGHASPEVADRSEPPHGDSSAVGAVSRLEINELYYDALENPSPRSPRLPTPSPLTEKNLWLCPGGSKEAKLETIQRALRYI